MDGGQPPSVSYPGASATPEQVLDLANAYAEAAKALLAHKINGCASSQMPSRLCALHGIELYLHAFLRFRGATPAQIRARRHDVWHEEFALCLQLDAKTCAHLKHLTAQREYLMVRYAPDHLKELSPPTRISATLLHIQGKSDRIPFAL
jgi:hypothetical protein